MRHIDERNRQLAETLLQRALAAVHEDDAQSVPQQQLNERVMRAWDSRSRPRRRRRAMQLSLAAAATIVLALTWVLTSGRQGSRPVESQAGIAAEAALERDAFLAPDVLMDEASSVQYVRLSLAPRAMAAFGIPVADPSDDRPIAVDALIGIDGIPRAVRYVQVRGESR